MKTTAPGGATLASSMSAFSDILLACRQASPHFLPAAASRACFLDALRNPLRHRWARGTGVSCAPPPRHRTTDEIGPPSRKRQTWLARRVSQIAAPDPQEAVFTVRLIGSCVHGAIQVDGSSCYQDGRRCSTAMCDDDAARAEEGGRVRRSRTDAVRQHSRRVPGPGRPWRPGTGRGLRDAEGRQGPVCCPASVAVPSTGQKTIPDQKQTRRRLPEADRRRPARGPAPFSKPLSRRPSHSTSHDCRSERATESQTA